MESSQRGRQRLKGGTIETMDEGINNTTDRITELPEGILHKILAFLEAKDAARTSTLSKRWESVWVSFPVLDFDETFWPSRKKFIDYVKNSLQQRSQVYIQKFKLCIKNLNHGNFKISSCIGSWIKFATKGNLEELAINISAHNIFIPLRHFEDKKCRFCYRLPQSIFTTESLTVLKLRRCKLVSSNKVKLPCLKTLCLEEIHAEDGIIQNLVSSSLLVETLILISCSGLKEFYCSSSQLQTLIVEYLPELNKFDIETPNLQSFSLSYNDQFTKLFQINSARLKSLSLCCLTIAEEIFHGLISKVPLLENLKVVRCGLPRKVKLYKQKLTSLVVFKCKNLVELEIDAPKLISFNYTGQMLLISLMNTSCKLHVELHLKPIAVDSRWFSELREILGWFGHAQILTICCKAHKTERFIIPKELRESSVPPLLDLKHLQLSTSTESIMNYEELIDSLLWISPNIETLSIDMGSSCKTLKV
ncbi:probable FBD-associated F-box protein At1g32375 [Telopea speciosissima]|uniref:probable FBD-associated F-box protein At1g32375 n=1 Tax=Telopea speciosissima TaxID=54955 RepID=UPI001CC3CA8F|nr:probable FBD-associated F-box protein At1g32375 [Telopea speciosissima]